MRDDVGRASLIWSYGPNLLAYSQSSHTCAHKLIYILPIYPLWEAGQDCHSSVDAILDMTADFLLT
jgi:hypothetical protein